MNMKAIYTQGVVSPRPETSRFSLDSLSNRRSTQKPVAKSKLLRSSFLRSTTLIKSHRTPFTWIRHVSHVKCKKNDGSSFEDSSSDPLSTELLKDNIAPTSSNQIRRTQPLKGTTMHDIGSIESEENAPRNKLEEIIWYKGREVDQMKKRFPIASLVKDLDNARPSRDFIRALKESYDQTGSPALIAEVKKASPLKGVLRVDFDPVEVAMAYEKGGAACLSVLTESKFFKGSFENLEDIRNAGVKCPLLCKEFIVDEWQLYYARTKGADAVLLIAAVLCDDEIKKMLKLCKEIGLVALVEVHDENEMDRMLEIDGIQLIGINNRNLGTLKVDISNTKKLLAGARGKKIGQKDIIVVSESGLSTPKDIADVHKAGVKAVLVGESIVKKKDPTKGIKELFGKDISLRDKKSNDFTYRLVQRKASKWLSTELSLVEIRRFLEKCLLQPCRECVVMMQKKRRRR